jgi:hypothetical protein
MAKYLISMLNMFGALGIAYLRYLQLGLHWWLQEAMGGGEIPRELTMSYVALVDHMRVGLIFLAGVLVVSAIMIVRDSSHNRILSIVSLVVSCLCFGYVVCVFA